MPKELGSFRDGYLVVLLRHGESVANRVGIRQGQAETPLTREGIQAVLHLAHIWKAQGMRFDRIITSPLRRAFHTALILAHVLEVPFLEVDPLWQERNIGALTLRVGTAVAATGTVTETRYTPMGGPQGESPWTLYARALRAWSKMETRPPGRYLVVTHAGLLNMLFHALWGLPPRAGFAGPYVHVANAGYAVLYREPGQAWQWRKLSNAP